MDAHLVWAALPRGAVGDTRSRAVLDAATERGTTVALWTDSVDGAARLYAMSTRSQTVRWAPLPSIEPHVVALISASLVREALSASPTPMPPRGPTPDAAEVRVRAAERPPLLGVRLSVPSAAVADGRAARAESPAELQESSASRQRRALFLELSAGSAIFLNGGALGLGSFVHPAVRLHGSVELFHLLPGELFGTIFAGAIAYTTDDDDGRFEVGLRGGLLVVWNQGLEGRVGRPVCLDPCNDVALGGAVSLFAGFSWAVGPDARVGFRGFARLLEQGEGPVVLPGLDLHVQVMP